MGTFVKLFRAVVHPVGPKVETVVKEGAHIVDGIEVETVKPCTDGGLDVGHVVVDEDRVLGVEVVLVHDQMEAFGFLMCMICEK